MDCRIHEASESRWRFRKAADRLVAQPAADRGLGRFYSGCAWDRWSGSAAGGGASSWPPWGGLFDGEGEPAKPGEPRRGAPCHIFAETVDP